MKTGLLFTLMLLITVLVIVLAVMLGDHGPWYFAWLVGTVMMVLVSASCGALFEVQQQRRRGDAPSTPMEDQAND